MDLVGFIQKFNTEELCTDWLASARWGSVEKASCPSCKEGKCWRYKNGKMYKCSDCKKQFSVRINTIFEDSRIPLVKWFTAIYLFTSLKKGLSSIQLSKYITVTQKTAWFMLQRIREVMKDDGNPFNGTTEVDEAYVGGKLTNMHMHKRVALKQKDDKAVVLGMVNRDTGEVKVSHLPNAKQDTIVNEVIASVKEGSVLFTDQHKAYYGLPRSYNHQVINHSVGEYCKPVEMESIKLGRIAFKVHTNSIEGFWSQLKRGINGIYHWCSKKHLQFYLNEYSSRYNTRELSDIQRFTVWFGSCEGKKLVYSSLVG